MWVIFVKLFSPAPWWLEPRPQTVPKTNPRPAPLARPR